ncbi:hypothetical protein [Marinitoga sp. 38H-ov]|nr:hypothetical protein [Marinitoga sp. 38H-ov]
MVVHVICSRAKRNLAIIFTSNLDNESINNIKELFGEENFTEVKLA